MLILLLKKTAWAALPCRHWQDGYRALPPYCHLWRPGLDSCQEQQPSHAKRGFLVSHGEQAEVGYLHRKASKNWEEGEFSPHNLIKTICQTADVSYGMMLLKQLWSHAHLLGTLLNKDSVFPFKLEGMSLLWPPQPHIFHHKAMTGEAPLGEQWHESLGKWKSLLQPSLENGC